MIEVGVKEETEMEIFRQQQDTDRMAALIATVMNSAGKIYKDRIYPRDIFSKPDEADPELEMLKASGKSHIRIPMEEYMELKRV